MTNLRPLLLNLKWLGVALTAGVLGSSAARAQPSEAAVLSPNWSMIIDDFGYADVALDLRPGFLGREYLSGEWAAAVSYVSGASAVAPTWLNPEFLYPDWTSNSDFDVETPVASTGTANSFGFPIYRSVIANASLRIGIQSEMIDTTTGIPQGLAASGALTGSNVLSDRYVFRQTFSLTNISGATLAGVTFFKFVHSLESSAAVYDDRAYPGTLDGHRYAITQTGRSPGFYMPNLGSLTDLAPVLHEDVVTQHGKVLPAAWEVGAYGTELVDDHVIGKPGVGVHLSVEAGTLSNLDSFTPAERWVSGAVSQTIGSLPANASISLEYLLSVRTVTTPVRLNIAHSNGSAVLSWPAAAQDYFWLKQADQIDATEWDFVPELVETQGTNNTVTVVVEPDSKFFKLGQ